MKELVIAVIIMASSLLAGFLWGMRYERIQWNKLIQSGALPKPGWTRRLMRPKV